MEAIAPRPVSDQVKLLGRLVQSIPDLIGVEISPELQAAWDNYEAVRELRALEKLHQQAFAKLEELSGRIASRRCELASRGVL